MKKTVVMVAVLAGSMGLALAWLMMPGESELALMRFKDKHYDEALQDYERLWRQGRRSVSVVVPLTRLYLAFGQVDKAVGLMEEFVASHPDKVEARRQLGKYYQYAQRPHDYLRNLEMLTELRPSEKELRELSDGLNYTGGYKRQIEVIESIIRLYPGRAQDYIDLAHLQAALGRVQQAFATMNELRGKHPRAVDRKVLELLLSLALDAHRLEEALTLAQEWLTENHDPKPSSARRQRRQLEQVASLAGLFRFKGAGLQALRLLRPYEQAAGRHLGLLMQLSELELVMGRQEKTFERLRTLDEEKRLPERAHPLYLRCALALDRHAKALELASRLSLQRAPGWLVAELVQKALEADRQALAHSLASSRGGDFLNQYPLVGAELALLRGDAEQLGLWLDLARRRALAAGARLHLAYLMQRAGRPQEAAEVLEHALRRGWGLENAPDLALLYQETGQQRRGYLFFHNLRQHHPHRLVEAAWAIMALAEDKRPSVLRWLGTLRPQTDDGRWLSVLGYQASRLSAWQVAEEAARHWSRLESNTESRLLLAQALSGNGKAGEALQVLRPLLEELGSGQAGVYQDALTLAWRQGLPVEEELVLFWVQRQRTGEPASPSHEEAVWALLELGRPALVLEDLFGLAHGEPEKWLHPLKEACDGLSCRERFLDFLESEIQRKDLNLPRSRPHLLMLAEAGRQKAALPGLKRLARLQSQGRLDVRDAQSPDWDYLYENALMKLERQGELLDLWRRKASSAQVSRLQKRSIAFRMLEELGARREAVEVFRRLAQGEGPQGENVEQLLFLWGHPLKAAQRRWLEGRVRRAGDAEEKAGWLRRLLDAGEARRAAGMAASARGVPGDWSLVTEVRMEALSQASMREPLAKLLEREIRLARQPDSWERLAKRAVDNDLSQPALMAFEKLLKKDARHSAALDWLGRHYFSQGRYSQSEELLQRLYSSGEAGLEALYYLAEMLRLRGEPERASRIYGEALAEAGEVLSGSPHQDARFAARVLQAMLLYRTGQRPSARQAFRQLLSARPYAAHLRADYAGLLLEEDEAKEAEALVAGRPPLKQAVRDASGWMSEREMGQAELRLTLLEAQALARQGRLGAALKKMAQLHRRHPDNPQVATQRASLERRVLRTRRALTITAQALLQEPHNEDVQEVRRRLLRETATQAGPRLEIKQVEDAQSEVRLSFQARHRFSHAISLEARWEQSLVQADQARFSDGSIGPLEATRQRAEIGAAFERENGTRWTAAFTLGGEGPGAFFSWQRPDPRGVTSLRAEFNRPNWEYLEGLANGLGRDRLEVERRQWMGRRWEAWLGAAFNRYRSGEFDPAAQSWAWQGRLQYEIREQQLYAAYGVEAEYESSSAQGLDPQARPFRPLSLTDREVHFLDLSWFRRLHRTLQADAYGGFSWDRLGGSGPFLGTAVHYDPQSPLSFRLWADQRLNSVDSGQKETRFGIQVLWSFEHN